MTKHRERPPLHLRPGASPRLAGFLLLTHSAAVVVVMLLPLPWYLRILLLLAVVAGLWYQVLSHLLRRLPWAVREACWESDGSWTLTLVSDRQVDARLLPSTYVSLSLVVLNFRCGRWRPCFLVLPSDSLDPGLLRRLRARLRLAGTSEAAASDALG